MGDIIPFQAGSVPAHIAARFGDASVNDELSSGVHGGFPILSFKGKVWHTNEGGTRTLVTNDKGDPILSLEVVILKANASLSKIYYKDGYEEGSVTKPDCYSHDAIIPALDAQDKQAEKCAICPLNAWGSRITDNGGKGKACSDSRRLAVAPAGDLERPMLLRVPAASLKALAKYSADLKRMGAPYNALVTKISFDHSVAHPSLTFTPLRWLDDNEAALVQDVLTREVVSNIIGSEIGHGDAAISMPAIAGTPPAALAPKAAAAVKKAKPAEVKVEEVAAILNDEEPAAPAPEPEVVAAKTETAKRQTELIDEADATLDDVLGMLDDD